MNRFSRLLSSLIWLIAVTGLSGCGGINPREQQLEATVAVLQTQAALPAATIEPAATSKPVIQTVIVRETAPAPEITPVVQTVVVRETAPAPEAGPVVQTVIARETVVVKETVVVEVPVTVTAIANGPSATAVPDSAEATPDTGSPASIGQSGSLLGSGVRIDPIVEGETKSGQGRLMIKAQNGKGEAIKGAYFRVYTQKKDLSDQVVIDREIINGDTDSTGTLVFDLDPNNYVVRAEFVGYRWGDAREVSGQTYVPVEAGKITPLTVSLGRLVVGFLRADKSVIASQYVRVYRQKQDLAGKWVQDGEVANGYTDNTGAIAFDLTAGEYIVRADFTGYNWGNATSMQGMESVLVRPSEETTLIASMGRLVIGLVDPGNNAISGKYVRVYTEKSDITGRVVLDNEIANGYTDNTGAIVFDLTPGKYAVRIDDRVANDVPVEAGKITTGDGSKFEVKNQ